MDADIETDQAELDDIDELASTITFRGNEFGGYLYHSDEALSFLGVTISSHNMLLDVLTTNIPDAAVGELVIIGVAPIVGEITGDEEIIEENDDPVVTISQNEYYIIDVKNRINGNPFRSGLVLSRNKGV